MKMPALLAAALATVTLAQPLFAADNPWIGTWKLNHDKSTMNAQSYTVVQKGTGTRSTTVRSSSTWGKTARTTL